MEDLEETVVPLKEEETVFAVLKKIGNTLSGFPEGFFTDLEKTCARNIGFYILSDTGKDDDLYFAVRDSEAVMAVSVTAVTANDWSKNFEDSVTGLKKA